MIKRINFLLLLLSLPDIASAQYQSNIWPIHEGMNTPNFQQFSFQTEPPSFRGGSVSIDSFLLRKEAFQAPMRTGIYQAYSRNGELLYFTMRNRQIVSFKHKLSMRPDSLTTPPNLSVIVDEKWLQLDQANRYSYCPIDTLKYAAKDSLRYLYVKSACSKYKFGSCPAFQCTFAEKLVLPNSFQDNMHYVSSQTSVRYNNNKETIIDTFYIGRYENNLSSGKRFIKMNRRLNNHFGDTVIIEYGLSRFGLFKSRNRFSNLQSIMTDDYILTNIFHYAIQIDTLADVLYSINIKKSFGELSGRPVDSLMIKDFSPSPGEQFVYYLIYVNQAGNAVEDDYLLQYDTENQKFKIVLQNKGIREMALGPNRKLYLLHDDLMLSHLNDPDESIDKLDFDFKYRKMPPDRYPTFMHNYLPTRVLHPGFVDFEYSTKCDSLILNYTGDSIFNSYQWFVEDLYENITDSGSGKQYAIPLKREKQFYIKCRGRTESGYIAWYSDTITAKPLDIQQEVKFQYPDTICEKVSYHYSVEGFSDTSLGLSMPEYHWHSPKDTLSDKITFAFENSGHSYLEATYSSDFCSETARDSIYIYDLQSRYCEDYQISAFIPNAFSPNNDGLNDFWAIETRNVKQIDLKVFNRWGQLVYKSKDKNFKWKGNGESTEPFFYILRIHGKYEGIREEKGRVLQLK